MKNQQLQENVKMCEESMIRHMEYHETQMGHLTDKIKRMDVELNMHKEVFNLSKHDAARWQKGFTELAYLSDLTMDQLPQKLKMVETELPFFNAPDGIRSFMEYCRKTLGEYKNKIIRARKGCIPDTDTGLETSQGKLDQIADKLDRVLEVLTNLNLHSQHVMGLNVAVVGANPSADLSSSKVTWPPSDLPVGYTSSGYIHPSNEGSAADQVIQVPIGTGTEFFANHPRAHQVLPRAAVP
ncbi:hypothetical protein A2U01_0008819, partial [Trifolium medium]|nr:hypothetical protein [Trifolium medium]